MLTDCHWHTARCGHAAGEMGEYLERAESLGLAVTGFSDHLPQYFLAPSERDPGLAMAEEELPRYVAAVRELQKSHPFLRLGVEADYIPGREKELADILAAYPFDYVIGSVHYIDGWEFDHPDKKAPYREHDLLDLYRRYFELVARSAQSGLFDVIAHPDLIKKFGFRPVADLTGIYRETARTLAASDVCVEVNTAGLAYPAMEIYPAPGFLTLCREYGVPASLGSDAHAPEQVGRWFDRARELLKKAGYTRLAVFKQRKRDYVEI
ncbi:MAG: histidinol-phosphatase HisJ family protein [Peptococcaceae bacterium]|jgi:histidinol-phosphatase (PHP family)|nr:histidinol-phosphatase HisJ family protein [Peptococcaceae bacterium]